MRFWRQSIPEGMPKTLARHHGRCVALSYASKDGLRPRRRVTVLGAEVLGSQGHREKKTAASRRGRSLMSSLSQMDARGTRGRAIKGNFGIILSRRTPPRKDD